VCGSPPTRNAVQVCSARERQRRGDGAPRRWGRAQRQPLTLRRILFAVASHQTARHFARVAACALERVRRVRRSR